MYLGVKELIEEKSEIFGCELLDPAIDEAVNPSPAAIDWDHRRIRHGHNFGASPPGPALMGEYDLTAENVCKRALALLENRGRRLSLGDESATGGKPP